MWEPYLKVIREKCSEALHILDRFHIVAKMNKALDEVRAGESRRMASEGRVPVLKKSRWLLLKREENLKTEQLFRLRDLLRYNLLLNGLGCGSSQNGLLSLFSSARGLHVEVVYEPRGTVGVREDSVFDCEGSV